MTINALQSPFHRGEQRVQSRLGVRDIAENLGNKFIHNYLPEQHREFLSQLPYMLVSTVDESGRPWASILAGRPGFLSTPDARTLEIQARPIFGDPLNENLASGVHLGMLGIEYHSRRRNRLSGRVSNFDSNQIVVQIDQAFGNCPQYLQSREYKLLPGIDHIGEEKTVVEFDKLGPRAIEIISNADNFYIATQYSENPGDPTQGADVSHRGGKPGFVKIEDDKTIKFPDYNGNNHFNTFGNIEMNPRAGLLFVDFDNGDLLYLTCKAEIIWHSEEARHFVGAERMVKLTLDEGRLIENAMPVRWKFIEYSPSLLNTGSWDEVEEKKTAIAKGNQFKDYTVTRVESESESIKSFYLQPADGDRIYCHRAGQFLPIDISLPGFESTLQRTYTISNAPNGEYFRLSIKREPASKPSLRAGLSSNFFHDHVRVGSKIRALPPRGKFLLEESSSRPVVLISGGVGITPMIGMLQQLQSESAGCGCQRDIWFIHGAKNSAVHAFNEYLRKIGQEWPCLNVHTVYSKPLASDVQGQNFDSTGHVDKDLLKSLLPLDDYDFYYCGPPPFMEALHRALKSLNVADERINYEFFGPAAAPKTTATVTLKSVAGKVNNRGAVKVEFTRSGITTSWDPSKGTLLDLAESEGLQPMYSCRSGICQTCSTKVISGEVSYRESPMIEPENNEALICCSYPSDGKSKGEDAPELVLDL